MLPPAPAPAPPPPPILPPAPPTFSTITAWPRIGRIFSAMMRAATSVEPPGGNGTTSVICRDGKVCACALARPATMASASAPISFRMLFPRTGFSLLLHFDAGGFDDRPPLVDLFLLVLGERLWRVHVGGEELLPGVGQPLVRRGVVARLDHRFVEPGDDLLRRPLRHPQRVPEIKIESRQSCLIRR